MEDPDDEWEIEEQSSLEAGKSKVKWIIDKGLWLGKKVLITGFVISSAPIVLPPLAVVTALGFAFSVPAGLVFASYACTEKLMSKLLPLPRLPLMLEYGTSPTEEDEMEEVDDRIDHSRKDNDNYKQEIRENMDEIVKEEGGEQDVGFGEEIEKEEEERGERCEVKRRGIETGNELDKVSGYGEEEKQVADQIVEEKGNVDDVDHVIDHSGMDDDIDKQELRENVNETVKEEGDEKDVGLGKETEMEEDEIEKSLDTRIDLGDEEIDVGRREAENEGEEEKQQADQSVEEEDVDNKIGYSGKDSDNYKNELRENMDEVVKDEGDKKDVGFEEEEEEESEQSEDTRSGIQMRIELSNEGSDIGRKEAENTKQEAKQVADQSVEEDGYDEDVGEDLEGEEAVERNSVEIEYVIEERVEEPVVKKDIGESPSNEVRQVVVAVKRKDHSNGSIQGEDEEVEELGGERLLENISNEENIDISVVKDEGNENWMADKPLDDINEQRVVVIEETGGIGGENGDKMSFEEKDSAEGKETPFGNKNAAAERLVSQIEGRKVNEWHEDTQERSEGHMGNGAEETKQVGEMENSQSKDAENVHGDIVDVEPALKGNKMIHGKNLEEKEKLNGVTTDRFAATSELPVSSAASELNIHEVPTKRDDVIPSNEAPLSEERIWEQIEAIRSIVGYEAAPRPTTVDELKALYVFTGVEPPSSFDDFAVLAEVEEKLRFLMSIVGVK